MYKYKITLLVYKSCSYSFCESFFHQTWCVGSIKIIIRISCKKKQKNVFLCGIFVLFQTSRKSNRRNELSKFGYTWRGYWCPMNNCLTQRKVMSHNGNEKSTYWDRKILWCCRCKVVQNGHGHGHGHGFFRLVMVMVMVMIFGHGHGFGHGF